MKPIVQKLPKQASKSFVSTSFSTPLFETPWHRHIENEILYIKEGYGTAIIGDFVGEFTAGDLFYIGSNVPHWFRKDEERVFCTVVVIQFDKGIFGNTFLNLPELSKINQLIHLNQALSIDYSGQTDLIHSIQKLENTSGYEHLGTLMNLLNTFSVKTHNTVLTNEHINSFDAKGIIDEILEAYKV